jgi:hypothetical protein
MWMRDAEGEPVVMRHGRLVWTGLAVASVLTIVFGLFPETLLSIVETAAAAIS